MWLAFLRFRLDSEYGFLETFLARQKGGFVLRALRNRADLEIGYYHSKKGPRPGSEDPPPQLCDESFLRMRLYREN